MVDLNYLTTFEMSPAEKRFFSGIGNVSKGLAKTVNNLATSFYHSVPAPVKLGIAAVSLVGLGMVVQSIFFGSESGQETCHASYYEKTCSKWSCSDYEFRSRDVSGQDIQDLSRKVKTHHVADLNVNCR